MNEFKGIQFVNHASFIIETHAFDILVDPWLFGNAFNNGWSLICETPLDEIRFQNVKYIWISHEHPDHFAPSCMKYLVDLVRDDCCVLYQATADRRLVEFCSKLGFSVAELENREILELSSEVSVCLAKVPYYDSCALFDVGGVTILNLNDCILDSPELLGELESLFGRGQDFIFTQFSYANWVEGGPDWPVARASLASGKIEIIRKIVAQFRPQRLVLFASFIYFCNEQNCYMNDSVNSPASVVGALSDLDVIPVVLKPGQGLNRNISDEALICISRENCDWWEDRYSDLSLISPFAVPSLSVPELENLFLSMVDDVRTLNGRVWVTMFGLWCGSLCIYLEDIDVTVRIRWIRFRGNYIVPSERRNADVRMDSRDLAFTINNTYGVDTINVNARFSGSNNGRKKLIRFFSVRALNNMGIIIKPSSILDREIRVVLMKALKKFSIKLFR